MQWLSLYELSHTEFGTVVHTMLEVFPQVTLWRANFNSNRPVLGIAGHISSAPLDPDTVCHGLNSLLARQSRARSKALAAGPGSAKFNVIDNQAAGPCSCITVAI